MFLFFPPLSITSTLQLALRSCEGKLDDAEKQTWLQAPSRLEKAGSLYVLSRKISVLLPGAFQPPFVGAAGTGSQAGSRNRAAHNLWKLRAGGGTDKGVLGKLLTPEAAVLL